MKNLASILLVAFLASVAWAQTKRDSSSTANAAGIKFWNSSQGKWIDNPTNPRLHEMVVSGEPAKPGFTFYLKLDPGAEVPWHWHSGPEIAYGDTGKFEVRTLKGGHTMTVTSGSYARMPAHMVHNATCVSKEPCTMYIESPQIFDYHEVDGNGKEIKPATANSRNKVAE